MKPIKGQNQEWEQLQNPGTKCATDRVRTSLHPRRNLTSVSNVCAEAPIFLFWRPNGPNELQEVRFEFSFILIGTSTMTSSTGKSWRSPGTQLRAQNKDIGAILKTDVTKVKFKLGSNPLLQNCLRLDARNRH